MDSIKRTTSYTQKLYWLFYLLAFLLLGIYFQTNQRIILLIMILDFILLGIVYDHYQKKLNQQLKQLIHNADAIIEQKDMELIDGEGEISLLSHKLYTLSKRYHIMSETMLQEQVKLKDYIEDISHQLKTPITSMRINEELLLEVIDDQKQLDKLKHIYQQTIKMNKLVNDLLTLALLDSNSIVLNYQNESIESLIDEVEENLEYLLIENHMQINIQHHQEKLFCDRKWLGEALENIIKNCLENNHDQCLDIKVYQNDSLIKILIQDHGKGIDEDDLHHLFERFYRSQQSQKEGVGIGLSLAKEIIEKHHGMINVYNDQGAVFELTFPKFLAKRKL